MAEKCILNLGEALRGAGLSEEAVDDFLADMKATEHSLAKAEPGKKSAIYAQLFAERKYRAEQKRIAALNNAEIEVRRTNSFLEVAESRDLKIDYAVTDWVDGNITTQTFGAANGYNTIRTSLFQYKQQDFMMKLQEAGGEPFLEMWRNMYSNPDYDQSLRILQEAGAVANSMVAKERGEAYVGPAPGHTGDKFAEVVGQAIAEAQYNHNIEMKALGAGPRLTYNYYLPQKHFADLMRPSGPAKLQAYLLGYNDSAGNYFSAGKKAVEAIKLDYKRNWIKTIKELGDIEKIYENAEKIAYASSAPKMRRLMSRIGQIEQFSPAVAQALRKAIDTPRKETTPAIEAIIQTPFSKSARGIRNKLMDVAENSKNAEDVALAKELLNNPLVTEALLGTVIPKDVVVDLDTLLSHIYDGITNPFDHLGVFSEMGKNQYERMMIGRVIEFKDAKAWLDYQNKYAHGNIAQAMTSALRAYAREEAYGRTFGTNAKDTFARVQENVRNYFVQKRDEATNLEARARYEKKIEELSKYTSKAEILLDYVDGKFDVPSNATLNRVVTGLMNLGKLRLGQSVFPALSDINTRLDVLSRVMPVPVGQQVLPLLPMGDTLKYLDFAPIRRMYRDKQAMVHSFVGMSQGVANRLTPAGMPEVSSAQGDWFYSLRQTSRKAMDWYMNMTMTNQVDEAGRACVADQLCTYLGNFSANGGTWNTLGKEMQGLLRMTGIDEEMWKVVSKKGLYKYGKEKENWAISAWQLERSLTNQDVIDYLIAKGRPAKEISEFEIITTKSRLVSTFDEAVTAFANTAIVTPNIETRAFLQGGRSVDDPWRAVQVLFTEFLSYPTRITFDLHRSIAYDFSKNGPARATALARVAKVAALGLGYGYMSLVLKDAINGDPPRDPLKLSTIMKSMEMGGSLGAIGESILHLATLRTSREIDRWLGPTGSQLLDLFDLTTNTVKGDMTVQKVLDTMYRQMPNLMWSKWVFDKFFWAEIYKLFGAEYDKSLRQLKKQEEYGTIEDLINRFTY